MLSRALLILALLGLVLSDTPANCTWEDAHGTWVFYEGPARFTNSLDCASFEPQDAVASNIFRFSYPNLVTGKDGTTGRWTMVYNQGFEFTINQRVYFAFANYTSFQNGSAVSHCHSTLPGWTHDVDETKWGCYIGTKLSKEGEALRHESPRAGPTVLTEEHMQAINAAQTTFTVTLYDELRNTSAEQFASRGRVTKLSFPEPAKPTKEQLLASLDLPESLDWRNIDGKSYVSPVRDQLQCGSCYTFGSAGMMEARLRILSNNTVQTILSPQEILDCSEYGQGCNGGFPYLTAGKYGMDFGLVAEECVPYVGADGKCPDTSNCKRYYSTDYGYVGGYYGACNEALMRLELANNGPIAVSFMVYNDLVGYKGGVYRHSSSKMLQYNPFQITDHTVLIVGYGFDKTVNLPYWTVKNSWGTNWGEQGYFRIVRGTNECSIESIAVRATPALP